MIDNVKISKQKLEERTLMHLSLDPHYWPQQEEIYLASLTGSVITLLPQPEEEKIPPCQVTAWPMGDYCNSDDKMSLYLEL